jgi:putative membrane protein
MSVFGVPYHMGGGMWFPFVLWWLFWIGVVAMIVFLVVRLLRSGGSWAGPPQHPDAAEEILHRRLANGEIDVDEYERRMAALRAQRPPRT